MGYACPVCEVPQQDAEHLANHLAFTALLHENDHADWLDESVPDWREGGPEDLAPQVAELAEESDYEDTTEQHQHAGRDHQHAGHQHGDQSGHELGIDPAAAGRQAESGESAELDAEAQSVLREARAMTREMLADESGDEPDADAEDAEAADTDAPEDADGNS
jgi:hypothetical protein